jgi:hypothetical protein
MKKFIANNPDFLGGSACMLHMTAMLFLTEFILRDAGIDLDQVLNSIELAVVGGLWGLALVASSATLWMVIGVRCLDLREELETLAHEEGQQA